MYNNKNKKIILVIAILTMILTIIGGSLAYFSWISSEAQKTNIVFTVEKNFSCAADGGGSITNNDALIAPTLVNDNTTANYIKRAIKVTPTINEAGTTIYMDLWLDINKLDSGLSNSTNFKYAFTTSSTSNTTGVLASGTFNGKIAGDKVSLFNSKGFNSSNPDTYYLWIWLDSAETSSSTMNQTFNLSLGGSCTPTSVVNSTVSNINNYKDDTVDVILSNPYDHDIEASISYEDEMLMDSITIPANTKSMKVGIRITEKALRKSNSNTTNYLTVTVNDNGKNTKYNTNAGFTKSVHYLAKGSSLSSDFFGQKFDKSTIKSITFIDNNTVPSDAIGSMDVSSDKSGTIMAWYYEASDYTDTNKLYDFYIGSSDGLVYANPNSGSAFYGMTKLTNIDFTYFDTSQVTTMVSMFVNCSSLTSLDLSKFDTSKVTDMNSMFANSKKLVTLDISSFDTSKVTNMSSMFNDCNSLTSLDLSNFDTSQVTNMSNMFCGCRSLTALDLSNFNTSKVTNMSFMFYSCRSLTALNVSNFDTSQVTTMSNMFYYIEKLTTLNLSNFNTSNVTNMQGMFGLCSSLTSLDISNFDTSKVTDISSMFYFCSKLTSIDLSSFDTSKTTTMNYMFYSCNKLTTIYVSDLWNTSKVTSSNNMFSSCSSLKGAVSYSSGNITVTMANYTTGYLTYKAK